MRVAILLALFAAVLVAVGAESALYQRRVLNTQFYDGKKVLASELSAFRQVPGSSSDAEGLATCVFNPRGDLNVQCSVIHTVKDVTSIALGLGTPGTEGVVFFEIATNEEFLEFEFVIADSDGLGLKASEIVSLILSGEAFIFVASESFSQGEIRGQLTAEYTFVSVLDSDQLVPFNENFAKFDSQDKGLGLFSLVGNQLSFKIIHTVDDNNLYVSGIYKAAFGRNGNLVSNFERSRSVISESITLNDTMINAIYHSNMYVKILSKLHAFGEIRGQIVPLSPIPRITHTSILTPVEGVKEKVFGCALFAYNCETNLLEFIFQQNVAKSTLRVLDAVNEKIFSVDFDDDVRTRVDSFRINELQQIDLVFDDLSIVVVTDEYPDGILKGSITHQENQYTAYLQGNQVVGGSTTPFSGCGIFTFDDENNQLTSYIQHDIPESQSGPSVDFEFGGIAVEEGHAFSITRPGQPFVSGLEFLSYDEELALKGEELHVSVKGVGGHRVLRGLIKPIGTPKCLP